MSYRSALSASFPGGSLPKLNYFPNHLGDNSSDAGTPIERCRRPTIAWPGTALPATPAAAAAAAATAAVQAYSPDAAVVIAEDTHDEERQQQQLLTEPLLLPASPVKDDLTGVGVQQHWGSALWFELHMVLLLALPTVVTSAAQQVIIITSQVGKAAVCSVAGDTVGNSSLEHNQLHMLIEAAAPCIATQSSYL
jgi:hypothetical protein